MSEMIYALKLEQNIIHYYYLAYEMENGRKIIDFLKKEYIENHPNFVPMLFSTKLIARLVKQRYNNSLQYEGIYNIVLWKDVQ